MPLPPNVETGRAGFERHGLHVQPLLILFDFQLSAMLDPKHSPRPRLMFTHALKKAILSIAFCLSTKSMESRATRTM
jgi:hypothetical protein